MGLSSIDDTCTYCPPIWLNTSAYWFSAPMASTTPEPGFAEDGADPAGLPVLPHAAKIVATTARAGTARTVDRRHAPTERQESD